MEKKRALIVNGLTIAAVLLLIVAVWLLAALTPRKITPTGGVLEGFEPVQIIQAPESAPSSREASECLTAC